MGKTGPGPKSVDSPAKRQRGYEKPIVLASYDKTELVAAMQPKGDDPPGCSCGCGSRGD